MACDGEWQVVAILSEWPLAHGPVATVGAILDLKADVVCLAGVVADLSWTWICAACCTVWRRVKQMVVADARLAQGTKAGGKEQRKREEREKGQEPPRRIS